MIDPHGGSFKCYAEKVPGQERCCAATDGAVFAATERQSGAKEPLRGGDGALSAGGVEKYWGEAISTANYLQNRLPTSTVSRTPYELWHGKKPSCTHLREFGSEAYVHVPKEKRRKLDAKAVKMIFNGYAEGRKAYRFLHPDGDWIVISRH